MPNQNMNIVSKGKRDPLQDLPLPCLPTALPVETHRRRRTRQRKASWLQRKVVCRNLSGQK